MINFNVLSITALDWLRTAGELLSKFKPEYADIIFAVATFGIAYFFSDKLEGRIPITLTVGILLFLLLKAVSV